MKVSIITAVLNAKDTIEECIKSVYRQNFENIEHIIIDGGSTDGTSEIIRNNEDKMVRWVCEQDDGIYPALNKGLGMATGDIIGFLHADDVYCHNNVIDIAVSRIMNYDVDSCYGDLVYVHKNNVNKIVRYWKSCPFTDDLLQKGWMPPHPAFFARKKIYDTCGNFNTDFKIAADYELVLRFLGKNRISTHYIPDVLVRMRTGGASNRGLRNMLIKSAEDYRALKMYSRNRALYTLLSKNVSKISQFFKRY